MNNRRKFLTQGALAACAFTFLKPFSVNAALHSTSYLDAVSKENKLMVLHGNNLPTGFCMPPKLNGHIIKLAANSTDNCFYLDQTLLTTVPFPIQIETKGNVTVGIIHLNNIRFNNNNLQHIADLNQTALFLKEKKSCHFIICHFHDALKNNPTNFSEEEKIAKMSSHIDLIACKKEKKLNYNTVITHNKNRHEVMITATFNDAISNVTMLEINFDHQLKKTNVFTPINAERYIIKKMN